MKSFFVSRILIALLFITSAVLAQEASATDRYVKTSCTNAITTYNPVADTCTGGSALVYSSINNGITAMAGGDTLYIRAGTYTQQFTLSQFSGKSGSGSDGVRPLPDNYTAPTTVQAYGADVVTIKPASGAAIAFGTNSAISVQWVIFKNLILDGSSNNAKTSDVNCVEFGGGGAGGTIARIKLDNVEIKNCSGNGMALGGDDGVGKRIWMRGGSVHFTGTGENFPGLRHSYYVETDNNIIEYADIYDSTAFGIHNYCQTPACSGSPQNNIYRYNRIHNTGTNTTHGAAAILLAYGGNNKVQGNVIYGNQGGIGVDGNSTGNTIDNNTVVNSGVNFGTNPCCNPAIAVFSGSATIRNNLLFGNVVNSILGGTQLTNSILTVNPFVDSANNDYRLTAQDTGGTNLSAEFTLDLVGTTWPVPYGRGAYAFSSPAPFCPSTPVQMLNLAMNEGTGLPQDSSSAANNVTTMGSGNSWGTNYVLFGGSAPMTINQALAFFRCTTFTTMVWLYLPSLPTDFAAAFSTNYKDYIYAAGPNTFCPSNGPFVGFNQDGDKFACYSNPLPINTWVNIAAKYEQSLGSLNIKLYINGLHVTSANATATIDQPSGLIYLGGSPFGELLPAGSRMGPVKGWNYALTDAEIVTAMGSAPTGAAPMTWLTIGASSAALKLGASASALKIQGQ